MKYCVSCIARCDKQGDARNSDREVTVEIVTLSTQTIWHVTPSKYIKKLHCTFKLYDYCRLFAVARHTVLRVLAKQSYDAN